MWVKESNSSCLRGVWIGVEKVCQFCGTMVSCSQKTFGFLKLEKNKTL